MNTTTKKRMSKSEFADYIVSKFHMAKSPTNVYDRLIEVWPIDNELMKDRFGIPIKFMNDRKLFNDIYKTLAEKSCYDIDAIMTNWIDSPYYKIAKSNT